jgi:hypothetical protein
VQCPTFGEFEISSIGLGFIYVHENFNSFIVESVGMEKCEVVVSSPSSNSTLGGCGILQTHTFFEVFEYLSKVRLPWRFALTHLNIHCVIIVN